MDYVYIKNLVEEKYSINVQSVEKIKNVYKIIDNSNSKFCLKVIGYEYPHFYFIISAMEHLKNNNYKNIGGNHNDFKRKESSNHERICKN